MRCLYIFLLLLSSCGSVTIPDATVCGDLGANGAHCQNTLSDNKQDYNKPTWDYLRYGWLCMDPDDFSATESALDQLCNEYQNCSYETKKAIKRMYAFKKKIKTLTSSVK